MLNYTSQKMHFFPKIVAKMQISSNVAACFVTPFHP